MQIQAKDRAGGIDEIFTTLPELFGSNVSAIGHRLVHDGQDQSHPRRT